MNAHTPGPWDYRDPDGKVRANGEVVATVWQWLVKDRWDERDANARLIAAAPDLLAALRQVVASAFPNPTEHPAMSAAWKVAEAAIAKAEGGGR